MSKPVFAVVGPGKVSESFKRFHAETHGDDCLCPTCECCCRTWSDCWSCGGEGGENRSEDDPIQFAEDDWLRCEWCRGKGGGLYCGGCCSKGDDE